MPRYIEPDGRIVTKTKSEIARGAPYRAIAYSPGEMDYLYGYVPRNNENLPSTKIARDRKDRAPRYSRESGRRFQTMRQMTHIANQSKGDLDTQRREMALRFRETGNERDNPINAPIVLARMTTNGQKLYDRNNRMRSDRIYERHSMEPDGRDGPDPNYPESIDSYNGSMPYTTSTFTVDPKSAVRSRTSLPPSAISLPGRGFYPRQRYYDRAASLAPSDSVSRRRRSETPQPEERPIRSVHRVNYEE